MEDLTIFDDFEEPTALQTTFCQQVSGDDYSETVTSETDKALGELCLLLDKNPEVYANVLRKRKREEVEQEGIVSFMKSKISGFLDGQEYLTGLMSDAECLKHTRALKVGMCRTFQYAEDLKHEETKAPQQATKRRKSEIERTTASKEELKAKPTHKNTYNNIPAHHHDKKSVKCNRNSSDSGGRKDNLVDFRVLFTKKPTAGVKSEIEDELSNKIEPRGEQNKDIEPGFVEIDLTSYNETTSRIVSGSSWGKDLSEIENTPAVLSLGGAGCVNTADAGDSLFVQSKSKSGNVDTDKEKLKQSNSKKTENVLKEKVNHAYTTKTNTEKDGACVNECNDKHVGQSNQTETVLKRLDTLTKSSDEVTNSISLAKSEEVTNSDAIVKNPDFVTEMDSVTKSCAVVKEILGNSIEEEGNMKVVEGKCGIVFSCVVDSETGEGEVIKKSEDTKSPDNIGDSRIIVTDNAVCCCEDNNECEDDTVQTKNIDIPIAAEIVTYEVRISSSNVDGPETNIAVDTEIERKNVSSTVEENRLVEDRSVNSDSNSSRNSKNEPKMKREDNNENEEYKCSNSNTNSIQNVYNVQVEEKLSSKSQTQIIKKPKQTCAVQQSQSLPQLIARPIPVHILKHLTPNVKSLYDGVLKPATVEDTPQLQLQVLSSSHKVVSSTPIEGKEDVNDSKISLPATPVLNVSTKSSDEIFVTPDEGPGARKLRSGRDSGPLMSSTGSSQTPLSRIRTRVRNSGAPSPRKSLRKSHSSFFDTP